jgi:hypothetical protein
MRPYRYPAYWYNPYIPMVKYADASRWQNVTPYLQAAGIGGGIGALGGAGVGALMGRGDWKKALKSALIGMVAGAVVGPAVYAGYSALFPGEKAVAAPPVTPVPTQSVQPAVAAPPVTPAPTQSAQPAVAAPPVTPAPTQSAQPAVLASVPQGLGGPPIVENSRLPRVISWREAHRLVRTDELARREWELQSRPLSHVALQQILQSVGYNVVVAPSH